MRQVDDAAAKRRQKCVSSAQRDPHARESIASVCQTA
jgi:hypothetical protein